MRVFCASDHAGITLRLQLLAAAETLGHELIDLGPNSPESVDYPDFANLLAASMQTDLEAKGILVCGSGIGISIAANRHAHIRAALCHNQLEATLARQHNDANVIAFGARLIGVDQAVATLTNFLTTDFEGGRHQKRVDKLTDVNI